MNRNHPDYGKYIVRQLREETFRAGHPFMIYEYELPDNYFYYEYMNGKIELLYRDSISDQFVIVRQLSDEESDIKRVKWGFEKIS